MYHNSRLTPKARQNIIDRTQTGKCAPMSLKAEIQFLTWQIKTAREYSPATAGRLELRREELKARLYVSEMPTLEESIEDFEAETELLKLFAKMEEGDYPSDLFIPRRTEFVDQINNASPLAQGEAGLE